jgi:hypothetical protein
MIAPLFDRCMLCGRPVRRQGEILCLFHDFQAQIELGAERMRARVRMGQGRRTLTNGIKRLSVAAIRNSQPKGE